jgi:nicotinate phosphoribosyltransferase
LSAAHAPFDSYGVGTKMGMSADAPWTDMSYKLVEYESRPVLKLSPGKASYPASKQVFRWRDSGANFSRDTIAVRDEQLGGEPLLVEYMRAGKIRDGYPSLSEIRQRCAEDVARLPPKVRAIREPARFAVEFSPNLRRLRAEVEEKVTS